MPRGCWAISLGGCGGGISEEHLFSESVLAQAADHETKINLQGLPFCLNAPIRLPIARIVANNLCRDHNTGLSSVDAAGVSFFEALGAAIEGHAKLNGASVLPPWATTWRLDGPLTERWFLKTLINGAWHGDLPIGAATAQPGMATPELVEIAFGARTFTGRAGLFFAPIMGETTLDEFISLTTVSHVDGYVAGGLFVARGFRIGLCLLPAGFPDDIGSAIDGWNGIGIVMPPRALRFDQRGVLTHQLRLTWPAGRR